MWLCCCVSGQVCYLRVDVTGGVCGQGGEAQWDSAGERGWRLYERWSVSERTEASLLGQQLLIRHRINGVWERERRAGTEEEEMSMCCMCKRHNRLWLSRDVTRNFFRRLLIEQSKKTRKSHTLSILTNEYQNCIINASVSFGLKTETLRPNETETLLIHFLYSFASVYSVRNFLVFFRYLTWLIWYFRWWLLINTTIQTINRRETFHIPIMLTKAWTETEGFYTWTTRGANETD